jgi:hypothetical protein
MGVVTMVLEGEDSKLVRSILNVVNAQKKMEGGVKDIGSASATMERQVVGSYAKIDSAMRANMREFEAGRRRMAISGRRSTSPRPGSWARTSTTPNP